jgi:hypothetical protein
LLRDAFDPALDRILNHPVKDLFRLLTTIIRDANTFNQMLKAMASLRLMNECIETLSKEGDPDVRRIPIHMNVAGVKIREAQMDQEDSSWWKAHVEDPRAMAMVYLRAIRHSEDTHDTDRLKSNEFSGYMDQLPRFVRTSRLVNKGNCTFATTSGSRIMDLNMAHSAKA